MWHLVRPLGVVQETNGAMLTGLEKLFQKTQKEMLAKKGKKLDYHDEQKKCRDLLNDAQKSKIDGTVNNLDAAAYVIEQVDL